MEENISDDSVSSFSSTSSTASNTDKFNLECMPFKNEKGFLGKFLKESIIFDRL